MPAAPSREAAAAIAAAAHRARPSLHLLPPIEARAHYEREGVPSYQPPVHDVLDVEVTPRVPARLYRPASGTLPVVLFFHGGGWVVGSIDTHEDMCRQLAVHSGCAVLSVGYGLAPEHAFPTAVDDAEAALSWVLKHAEKYQLDSGRLAVAGDSAGGNIAAALTMRTRAAGVPLRLQVLFYPVTTTDLDAGFDAAYDGLVLSREELGWHQDQYLPDPADRRHVESSPLDCADHAGLPEAVVVVAECDPIATQGLSYAEALRAAGVPVAVHLHRGAIHGFAQSPGAFASGRTALLRAGEAMRSALNPG